MNAEIKSIKDSHKALNRQGLRTTNQRALILEIIRHGHQHLDASEVYRRARDRQPRLSLSTVYRTLQMFKKLGLVEELHYDDTHHYYEVKPSAEHHHLVCLGCGKIVEFEYQATQEMRESIGRQKGFDVTGVEVWMTGYCTKCRRNKK